MEKMADGKAIQWQDRTKEVSVRKVVAVELVSVDGVIEAPEEWAFSYSNDEMEEANTSGMAASDALLLGRVTYEALATFWPHQPGGTPMVDYINSVRKLVVSTTLEEVEWNNSTLIRGNVAEEIGRRWSSWTRRRSARASSTSRTGRWASEPPSRVLQMTDRQKGNE